MIRTPACCCVLAVMSGACLADDSFHAERSAAQADLVREVVAAADARRPADHVPLVEQSALSFVSLGMLQDDPAPDLASMDAPAGGGGGGDADLASKLQNPIADLISLPFQFNYDEGFGAADAGRLTLNIQPVIPISLNDEWNMISRTILPVIYQESLADGLSSDFGLGDTVQSLFFSPKDPVNGWIIGAGPVALLPTGTTPRLRKEQFGLGPTGVFLRQQSGWTYGALVNHLWALNDPDENERVNATFLQPFLAYTWPTATTLALNLESTFDWTAEQWTVPINLQLSQVMKLGAQPISLQVGGRYYAESPSGGPEWGVRFTFTMIFPK